MVVPLVFSSTAPAETSALLIVGVAAAMTPATTPRGAMGLSAFPVSPHTGQMWQLHGSRPHSPHGPAEEAAGVAGGVAAEEAIKT